MEVKILTRNLEAKLLPEILGLGRVPESEQSALQRDMLAGYLKGTWFSLPPTAGIFFVYLVTFHCAHIFFLFKKSICVSSFLSIAKKKKKKAISSGAITGNMSGWVLFQVDVIASLYLGVFLTTFLGKITYTY